MASDGDDLYMFYDAVDLAHPEEEAFLQAMRQLPGLLARKPLGVQVPIGRLPTDLRCDVLEVLSSKQDTAEGNAELSELLFDRFGRVPQVFLACPCGHGFAMAAKKRSPHAAWGGFLGPLALVYFPDNRHVVWHEALHLTGAKDCYALPDRGPTCEQRNCIMQYEPTTDTVGDWPFLCSKNLERMGQQIGNFWNRKRSH